MKKVSFLGLYNLKKDMRQFIPFGIILFITALILNIALVLVLQIDKSYDEIFNELNASNIDVMIPKVQDNDKFEKKIRDINGVKDVEKNNAISVLTTAKEFRGVDFEMNTTFYNMEYSHEMNKLQVIEELEKRADHSIYIPLYIAEFGQYKLGNKITFEIDGKLYIFTVAGIVQEMQYGNYSGGLMGVYLTEDDYHAIEKNLEEKSVAIYSVKKKENADSKTVMNEANKMFDSDNVTVLNSKYDSLTKESRTMVCNLIIGILIAFAFIVFVVCIFLCNFRIKNSIEENMANMGVQKALGYTSYEIIVANIFPYSIVSLIASISGIVVSEVIIPSVIKIIELQAGFNVNIGLQPKAMVITLIILNAFVISATYLSSRKIRKIQVTNAIMGRDETKLNNKNYIRLDKTSGNIHILLMLKQGISSIRQNILVFMVTFVMTILISFGGVLFYNVIMEPSNFMSSMSEESPSIIVKTKENKEKSVKEKLEIENEVNRVLKYHIDKVKIGSDSIPVFICEDYSKVSNNLCYQGENPKGEDEIAIGSDIAMKNGYKIGHTIEVVYDEKSFCYTIVGFIQSVNYQGRLLELTEKGFEKLNGDYISSSLYVYLNDEGKTSRFIDKIKNNDNKDVLQVINYYNTSNTAQSMYSQIIKVVIVIIVIISLMIVFLILYVTIKSLIICKKQELGIYKAIGYSSKHLILQIVGSIMPAVILAAYMSAGLSLIYMPGINNMIFKGIGIMKNQMQVVVGIQFLFATVLVIVTLLLCICLSLKIRKISAYSLIKE